MKEIISSSCQSFIQLVSASELNKLMYVPLLLITLAVVIIFLKSVFILFGSRHLSRKLKNNTPHTKKLSFILKKLGLSNKTYVVKSDKLFAFCYGMKNSKICLSQGLVSAASPSELEAVLRHEQYHLLHKDTLVMFGISVMQSVLRFIPLLANLTHNIHVNKEIKADTYAVKALGDKMPLVSIMKKILQQPQGNFAFIPAIGNYDTLGPRIYALTRHDFKSNGIGTLHAVFSIVILIMLTVSVLAPVYAHEIYNKGSESTITCSDKTQNASLPYSSAR